MTERRSQPPQPAVIELDDSVARAALAQHQPATLGETK